MSVDGLNVRAEELAIVKDILRKVIPDRVVWAFGSRVTGRTKKYSDLDLVILGDEPLPLGVMGELAEAFTESDLPYKVDLVDWATASDRFRRVVEEVYVVL